MAVAGMIRYTKFWPQKILWNKINNVMGCLIKLVLIFEWFFKTQRNAKPSISHIMGSVGKSVPKDPSSNSVETGIKKNNKQ
jgi:hypothetical protein